jgi:hypothetical protein
MPRFNYHQETERKRMIHPCTGKFTVTGNTKFGKTLFGDDSGPTLDPGKLVDAEVAKDVAKELKRHGCARPCFRVTGRPYYPAMAYSVSYLGQDTKNSDLKYYSLNADVNWTVTCRCIKLGFQGLGLAGKLKPTN